MGSKAAAILAQAKSNGCDFTAMTDEQREADKRAHRLARLPAMTQRSIFAHGAAYGRADMAQRLRRALADNSGPALEAAIDALCTMFEQGDGGSR